MIKKTIIITIILMLLFSMAVYATDDVPVVTDAGEIYENIPTVTARAIVESAETLTVKSEIDGSEFKIQEIYVRILEGEYKDEVILIENYLNQAYFTKLLLYEEGDQMIVKIRLYENGNIMNAYIYTLIRYNYLIFLAVLLLIFLLVIGWLKKGIKTILSLVFTIGVLVFVLIPLLTKGYSPLLVSIGCSLLIILVVFPIIGGFNSKSYSAILGTLAGLAIAFVLAYWVGHAIKLTGMSSEESELLLFDPKNRDYNLQGLLLSGIMIGCLGAIMDVAMSISSSITEINEANPNLTQKELFSSGMQVGKDIMGTMSNTLILAYTGSALTFFLVMSTYSMSFSDIINRDFVASEILRSLAGSIGMMLTIPLTALLASILISRKSKKIISKELK